MSAFKITGKARIAHVLTALMQADIPVSFTGTSRTEECFVDCVKADDDRVIAVLQQVMMADRSKVLENLGEEHETSDSYWVDFKDITAADCRITEGTDKYLGPMLWIGRNDSVGPRPTMGLSRVGVQGLVTRLQHWLSRTGGVAEPEKEAA